MAYTNYYPASRLFHGSMSSVMGTQLDVLLLDGERELLTNVWEQLENEVVRLDRMLNRFDESSEISRINRDAGHFPIVVNEEIWTILQDCQRYYQLTKGYFDITLQDFSQLLFEEKEHSLFFSSESMSIDLGGYGKGYALVKFKEILEKNEIKCALANFGNSSVLAIGKHPCGDYWPIGLTDPYTKRQIAELKLNNNSLSVSGNMPSHPKHIVNPFTGKYVEEHKMITVTSANPVEAEVLTTALMVVENEQEEEEILNSFRNCEKHIYVL